MMTLAVSSNDAREAAALERLAETLAELSLAATLWQVFGAEPLARILCAEGDAASIRARAAFTAYMLQYLDAQRDLSRAVQAALDALNIEAPC